MSNSSQRFHELSKKFCRDTELDLELAMQMNLNPKQEYEALLTKPSLEKCLKNLKVVEVDATEDSSRVPDLEPATKNAKQGDAVATSA